MNVQQALTLHYVLEIAESCRLESADPGDYSPADALVELDFTIDPDDDRPMLVAVTLPRGKVMPFRIARSGELLTDGMVRCDLVRCDVERDGEKMRVRLLGDSDQPLIEDDGEREPLS